MSFFIRNNKKFRKVKNTIDPDNIFLDSSNLPNFDVHQFEGHLEKAIPKKTAVLIGCVFFFIFCAFALKIGDLQLKQGQAFLEKGENNRLQHSIIFPRRGVIYDRNGLELVLNSARQEEGQDFYKREYSDYQGLAQIVGYVGYPLKDSSGNYYQDTYIGKSGVEDFFNAKMSGENGLKIVEKNARLEIKSESILQAPLDGESLVLSIDAKIQDALHGFISSLATQVGFGGGVGILMDVTNGEILALVSYPEYDLEIMSNSADVVKIQECLNADDNPFLNRATAGLYIPGSIVKPFLALGALNEKIITPTQQIFSSGSISVPNPYFPEEKTVFKDWKKHGWVDMTDALAVSSNVYFYAVGGGYENQIGLGIANINKYIKLFGFSEETGIEAFAEERGVVPNPEWKAKMFNGEEWRIGDTYHTAIGQYGFQITPLQAVRAVSALANNGKLLRPTIIKDGGDETNYKKIDISDEYFQVVQAGLRQAVETGTAGGLNIPFLKVSAKTGTAERGITKTTVNSWVIGYFPSDKPRYAFVAMMEEGPKDNQIGGLFVIRQLLEWMHLNTPEYLNLE